MNETVLPAVTNTPSQIPSKNAPLAFGSLIPLEEFRAIQSHLSLDYFKWDLQVGDVSTLFRQPLLVTPEIWKELRELAESLTEELLSMEIELLNRPELYTQLGIPKEIQNALIKTLRFGPTKSAARTLRFDFHYTTEGWCISEVNSDVPGGYMEASVFTKMMASHFPGAMLTGNPAETWADSLIADVGSCTNVALLSAPSYLEDQQVTSFLGSTLQAHGIRTLLLHHPTQLLWKNGYAATVSNGVSIPLDAIVRFYQAEWLPQSGRRSGWQQFFAAGKTPVSNCGSAILTESKRLPLVFNLLKTKSPTWQRLLPKCADPCEINWKNDDGWVLKATFSNTGDSVYSREHVTTQKWDTVIRQVKKLPGDWVLQKRFEPIRIDSSTGLVYPCIGVYTINGRAAGVYTRVSGKSIIDFAAMDAAFLVI